MAELKKDRPEIIRRVSKKFTGTKTRANKCYTKHEGVTYGSPRTERAAKLARLCVAVGFSISTVYAVLAGGKKLCYERAKTWDAELGGGVDLWAKIGWTEMKLALFDLWEG